MTRPRALSAVGLTTLAVAFLSFGQAAGPSAAMPRVTADPEIDVALDGQTWFLPGNGNAELTVRLATTGIQEPRTKSADRANGDVQIEIEAHDPIATRSQMDAFIAGVAAPSIGTAEPSDDSDTVIVDEQSVVDTVRVDLRDTEMDDGRITVRVVVEPQDDDPDQLAMPQQGIHPLIISVLRDGEAVSRIATFVERLPWGTTEPEADGVMELAVMGEVDGRPSLRPNGRTQSDPAVIDELQRIRETLDQLPEVPVTLGLRPELLEGLDRSGVVSNRTLVRELAAAVGERHLLSQPFVGTDPSSMVAVGLADAYVDELRRGEDTLGDLFPRAAIVRSASTVDTPLTDLGADLLRDLGVRNVVLSGDAAPSSDDAGSDAPDTDASRATDIALPGGGTLHAHVVDAELSAMLADETSTVSLIANHVIARILLWQHEIVAEGGSLDGRSLVLTDADGRLPDADVLAALVRHVERDTRVEFASLDAALGRTDVRTNGGTPLLTPTAMGPATDLTDLAGRLFVGEQDVASTGSMLPRGDDRLTRWNDLLAIAPSDGLTVEERDAYFSTVAAETSALRGAVVPPIETTFTLGGRSGDVSLSLRNDADVALKVVVRMASPKLLFPEGPATVELAPQTTTIVRIPVEARSNNTFPVTVEVLTPSQLLPVTAPVQLTARVTAFTGLGQVVTGAAVLILATWWIRHWRTNRRRRLATTGALPST